MIFRCDLSKIYLRLLDEENLLLENVHFELQPGNIYSIIGKNGTGKTTLLKALTLLLTKGTYRIVGDIKADGKSLLEMSSTELQQFRQEKVKYVFQDAMTSFDPLKKLGYYFKRYNIDSKEAEDMLSYFMLPSLKQITKQYPWQLSGGMIQRFSIVLALLMHPQLLVLDEPSSGLDAPIANLLLLKLKEFCTLPERSVLIITQEMDFVKAASSYIAHIENKSMTQFAAIDDYLQSDKRMFIK